MADLHTVPGLTLPLFAKVTSTGSRPRDGDPSQSSSLAGTELTLGDSPGPYELMHHSSRGCLASSSTIPLGPENTSPSPPQFQGLMSTEGPAWPPDHSGPEQLAWPEDGVCSLECTFRRQEWKVWGEEGLAGGTNSSLPFRGRIQGGRAVLLLLPRPEQKGHFSP